MFRAWVCKFRTGGNGGKEGASKHQVMGVAEEGKSRSAERTRSEELQDLVKGEEKPHLGSSNALQKPIL